MGQSENKPKPSGSSSFMSLIEMIFFFALMLLLLIPLLYQVGSDNLHIDNQHPLDHVFENEEHQAILKKLLNDKNKYIIIEGQCKAGTSVFAKHFASLQKNKRKVLMRSYIEDPYETAYVLFRYAKTLVEDQLDLEENVPKTWVLFGYYKDIPLEDVEEIKNNNPRDRIILVTDKRIKMKGFKHVLFPEVTMEELKGVMVEKLSISEQQANVLTHHYKTIPGIFKNLNDEAYSKQNLLGNQHKSLDNLQEQDKTILVSLCSNGKAKGKQINERLKDVGIVFYKNQFYWESDEARLNYELQTLSECDHTVVSEQILTLIYEEEAQTEEQQEKKEQEEKDEGTQDQNQEEQEQEKKSKKKKDKKKKSKKQKEQIVEEEEEEPKQEEEEPQPQPEEQQQEKPKKKEKKKDSKKKKNKKKSTDQEM